jgi:hypothetical protein
VKVGDGGTCSNPSPSFRHAMQARRILELERQLRAASRELERIPRLENTTASLRAELAAHRQAGLEATQLATGYAVRLQQVQMARRAGPPDSAPAALEQEPRADAPAQPGEDSDVPSPDASVAQDGDR